MTLILGVFLRTAFAAFELICVFESLLGLSAKSDMVVVFLFFPCRVSADVLVVGGGGDYVSR